MGLKIGNIDSDQIITNEYKIDALEQIILHLMSINEKNLNVLKKEDIEKIKKEILQKIKEKYSDLKLDHKKNE